MGAARVGLRLPVLLLDLEGEREVVAGTDGAAPTVAPAGRD